jgi:hypothetical protein
MAGYRSDFYSTSLETKIAALNRINEQAPCGLDDLFDAITDGAGGTNRIETDTWDGHRRSVMVLTPDSERVYYAAIVHDSPHDPEERAINGDQILRSTWVSEAVVGTYPEDDPVRLARIAVDVDDSEQEQIEDAAFAAIMGSDRD